MLYPVLYKKDSKEKIRVWCMELIGNKYRTISGTMDGARTTTEWTVVTKGKNIGRANETTPAAQALFEVEAKYAKKTKTSYHESIDDINQAVSFEPMSAKNWDDRKDKIKWGQQRVFVQPKLDGIRCVAQPHGLISRWNTPIVAIPHVWEAVKQFFPNNSGLKLDGELYNHDLKDDFGQIVSIVRKQDPSPEELALASNKMEYHLYDIPSVDLFDKKYSERYEALKTFIEESGQTVLKLVETTEVFSLEEADAMYDKYLDMGYEGAIYRLDEPYKLRRSNQLIKRKEFTDEEFTIIRVEEGKGNWSGAAKRVVFRNNQGEKGEVGAGLAGGKAYAKQVLKDADLYVGKQATIQFMGRSKDDLVPRHPTAKILHMEDRL